jgi:hypothetical protein
MESEPVSIPTSSGISGSGAYYNVLDLLDCSKPANASLVVWK